MGREELFVYLLKLFFLMTSPVTFLVGIFLLYDVETYLKIERFLARSYGPKKVFINRLEQNRESLQLFLLKRRHFIGVACLLNSLMAVFLVVSLIRR